METRIMVRMLDLFEPLRFDIPADFLQYSHFLRVVMNIDWTSSPGYPYMLGCPTNGQFFGVVNGLPSDERCEQIYELVKMRLRDRDCDPIRLFIKPEPHKLKKLEQGAYRLISSVSVIDQLIDHLLFAEMNSLVVEHCLEVPAKVGWCQLNGGWKMMPQKGWVSLDKSRWDWSAQPWVFQFLLKFRIESCLTRGEMFECWKALAEWRYGCLFGRALFVNSGGWLLRQRTPGVMKSGCVNTIVDNSFAQVVLHLRVCLELGKPTHPLMAMGDDTIQKDFEGFDEYVEALGRFCHVKQVVKGVEFAGHRFKATIIEPLYRGKHAFTLLHLADAVRDQTLQSYALLYHRSSVAPFMRSLIRRMGVEPPPSWFLDDIYDAITN